MTKIKTTIALDKACTLSVSDTTGFYDVTTNPNGFLPEANSDALTLNVYKLSHGYFLNILLYNKYATTPVISNPSDTFYKVSVVDTTYANNFTTSAYSLILDGSYTLSRYFIPSLEFFTAHSTNSIYNGVTMYYTDGTTIFKIIDSVATPITVTSFINADLSVSDCIVTSSTFISTCFTNTCYFKILSSIVDMNIGVCEQSLELQTLLQSRDILYMTLEVIKYLTDINNLSQIQKLIEALDICGGICASTLQTTDCGCHG